MSSLSKCLKKMGLSEHEGAILRGAARDYMDKDGIAAQEAAVQAVQDYIEELTAERADIVRQIEEAGGKLEAKAEEKPAAPEPVEESLSEADMRSEWDRAAKENGLPVFDQLTEEQQSYILGSKTNDEFNEAANEVAQELMGGEITQGVVDDVDGFQSKGRDFSDEEANSEGVRLASDQLRAAGQLPLLEKITSFRLVKDLAGNAGVVRLPNGSWALQVNDDPALLANTGYFSQVIRHEVAHIEDTEIGGYSLTEEFAGLMGEARRLYAEGWGGGFLAYPFSDNMPQEMLQIEAYAQLRSVWTMGENGRGAIQRASPRLAAFMRKVDEDVKQVLRQGQGAAQGQGRSTIEAGGLSERLARIQALAEAPLEARGAQKAVELPPAARGAWTNIKDWAMKVGPMMLTNFQLAEQFGSKLSKLKDYVTVQQNMNSKRLELAAAAHRVVTQWERLSEQTRETLNKLMLDATLASAHPDVGLNDPANAHLNAKQKLQYASLASRYRALPADAKMVYQAAKTQLEDNWKARHDAWTSMVNYTYNAKIAQAEKNGDTDRAVELTKSRDQAIEDHAEEIRGLKGPYFPLMRFGEHLAIGESTELRILKDEFEATGGNAKLQEKINALEKDPKHYIVSAHESRAAAEAALDGYKSLGLEARYKLSAPFEQKLRPASLSTITEFEDAVRTHLGGKVGDEVGKLLRDVYLRYSPENSALAREAQRRGIAGASVDMLRAFSAASERDSYYLSRLEYSPQLTDTLFALRREADKADLGRVYNEMAARAALDVTYSRTPVQGALSTLSWAWHLGASPSFLLINSTQPWIITVPILGAKFGLTRSMNAMRLASMDALSLLKDARLASGKMDWWSDIKPDAKRPDGSQVLTPGEQVMVKQLVQRGVLDIGMEHDLSTVAHDEHKGLAKTQKVIGWATQQVELVNRFSSALAAYRLGISRGMTADQAIDYAYETTSKTQLDYNEANAARLMRQGGPVPLAKLVFQFRKYQQGMLYLLGSNIKAAVKGDRQAMAALGYLMLSQGLVAGALGLPFMGTALWAASLFGGGDDEDGDAETRLRNYLAEIFGKDAGLLIAKGLPTLFGVDISKRAGMGDIASPFPYARFDGKTGAEQVEKVLGAAAGPVAGMAGQWYDALAAFGQGDFQKGVEKATPKMVADLARGYRFAEDGLADSKGRYIFRDDQFSTWDVLMRAAGFSPVKESEYYAANESKMEVETAIKERRQQLIDRWVKERLRDGPSDAVQEKIDAFNAAHNRTGELGKITRSTLLRALQSARKSEMERAGGGVRYRKAERGLEGLTAYVQ